MYNPVPMQVSQSDSGVHPSLVRPPGQQTVLASASQQQAMPPKQEKARACDQCNHSKVKCDSGRPCGAPAALWLVRTKLTYARSEMYPSVHGVHVRQAFKEPFVESASADARRARQTEELLYGP